MPEASQAQLDEVRRLLSSKESKIRAMLAQRDARLSEIEELRHELSTVTRSNRSMAALLEQCDRLRAGRERIREQHSNLLEAYTALRNEHASVRRERDDLAAEREQWRIEREQLRADQGRLRMERDQLRTERDKLREQRDKPDPVGGRRIVSEATSGGEPASSPRPCTAMDEDGNCSRGSESQENAPQTVAAPTNVNPPANGAVVPTSRATVREDDLKQIRGINRAIERALRKNGILTLAQIAGWTEAEIDTIALKLGVTAKRIRQEAWVTQARSLVATPTNRAPSP
jgi:predicted flap endonuclease-1-like 5' DNA nuclease